MNRRIIAIYDSGGKPYVDCAREGWLQQGFETVDMNIQSALSGETNLDEYYLITLTMGHHSGELYRQYVHLLRGKTSIPIVLFPYGDKAAVIDAMAGVYEGASQMITLPTVQEWAVANCFAIMRDSQGGSGQRSASLTLYADYKFFLEEDGYKAYVDDHVVALSKREFVILRFLMEHRGRFVTPDEIIKEAWGEEYVEDHPNILWNKMNALRRKIQWNDMLPQYIQTKRGKGYRFWPHYPAKEELEK